MIDGNYTKANAMIDEAIAGLAAIERALERDPDTSYVPPGEQAATTMR